LPLGLTGSSSMTKVKKKSSKLKIVAA
jgi:hypothetical protein